MTNRVQYAPRAANGGRKGLEKRTQRLKAEYARRFGLETPNPASEE
jgi:hypothetical protein